MARLSSYEADRLNDALYGMDEGGGAQAQVSARYVRTDQDGTTWVRFEGADKDTPLTSAMSVRAKQGDIIDVSLGGYEAVGGGNRTDPSAGFKDVKAVSIEVERVKGAQAEFEKLTAKEIEAEKARIGNLEADAAEIAELVAQKATIDDLEAATGRIGDLEASTADIGAIRANSAKVKDLTADQLSAATGYIADLKSRNITAGTLAADHAALGDVTADYLKAADLEAEQARVGELLAKKATVTDLNAATGRITTLESTKANISDMEADYITADAIDAKYMHANLSNSDVAWIQNGVIKDGSISSAMINDVSANKLTAGTINGSVINVTNLNADNITAGTINGQRIGQGSLSLDKLSEDVYTEAEVDAKLRTMQAEIDGAIETWTGTTVPTLDNDPAKDWKDAATRDKHVGDVYFNTQAGYNYRFTKSGTAYSWVQIKDTDITNALTRIQAAEGKITTFDSEISTIKTDTGELKTKTTTLETSLGDKVDVSSFNELEDTVDGHSQTLSQHTTAISNKADASTVNQVTSRVTKTEQDISGINTKIGEMSTTLEGKADGSTVETISSKLNTVSDTVDGHTQSISSVQDTLQNKADSSTVSTLSTKVNTVSDTVDGHTQSISSVTSTQTTIQKTAVKSTVQLWFTKANTTAPAKPTAHVAVNDASKGNQWNLAVPTYNSAYPNYYYCYEYQYLDGSYGWSAITRDIATGESQATARTAASDASTAKSDASTAKTNAASAVSTANTAKSTADSAATDASAAKTDAAAAKTDAATAKSDASTAKSDASTAKTNASAAVTTANAAKTTAEDAADDAAAAKDDAAAAKSDASTAKSDAATAKSDASTAKTNASAAVTTANTAKTTADTAKSTADTAKATADKNVKTTQQLWFTKANSTAPGKPTAKVTSTAVTGNAWTTKVPTYSASYPHYFYCVQYIAADGTVTWSDVVYDQATTEAQSVARTATSSLATLRSEYNETKTTVSGTVTKLGAVETTVKGVRDDLDNLSVGGRNLLRNTGVSRSETATKYGAWNVLIPTYKDYAIDLDEGEYTLSFDWEASAELPNGFGAWVGYGDAHGAGRAEIPQSTGPAVGKGATSGRYVRTFKWPDANSSYPYFACRPIRTTVDDGLNGITFTITNAKLEKGNVPTDWTPAPEDLETEVTSLKSDYATYKQTTTESLSQIGSTYATKGELKGAVDDISALERALDAQTPFVTGTQTAATYDWKGTCEELTELKDGQRIMYFLPFSVGGSQISATYTTISSGATTNTTGAALTLTLAGGKSTGQVPIWYGSGMGRITSHYAYGAHIPLIYREDVTMSGTYKIAKGWFVDGEYNSDTVYSRSISGGFYTGKNGVLSYGLCMRDENGRWTAIVNNKYSNTTQDKAAYTGGLDPNEVLYCSTWYSNGRVATDNTSVSGDLWASYIFDFRYCTNISANSAAGKAMTVRKPVYLVGTLNDRGLLVLDSSQWWTQAEPTSADGKVYIYLGVAYSWYQLALSDRKPLYQFSNGKFQEFAYSRMSNAETAIEQTKEQIALKANSEDVYTKTEADGKVTEAVNSAKAAIKITTDGISSEVSKKVGASEVISKINQSSDSVKIQAKHVEIDGAAIFSNSALKSKLDEAYDAKGAAKDAVDNLEIGGRNLVKGTSATTEKSGSIASTSSNNYIDFCSYKIARIEGAKTYTLSFEAYASSACNVYCYFYSPNTTTSGKSSTGHTSTAADGSTSVALTTEWKRYWVTWTQSDSEATDKNVIVARIIRPSSGTITVHVRAVKVETGSKPTDWSPAPEDVDAGIADAKKAGTDAQTTANNAAPKTAAVAEEQYIYISKASGTASVGQNTTWVTASGDTQNAWTTKRPTYSSDYPVLFVAKQRKTVSGTVTCTTPVKDDTTTVIDGGHITTGTIDATKATITNIDASKITTGTLSADRIKANVISAVNGGTGTINADKVNVSAIKIGDLDGVGSYATKTDAQGYADTAKSDAVSTAAADATAKANDAAKTAKNYISADSSSIRIASANPATQNQRLALTSSAAEFYDSGNTRRVRINSGDGVIVGHPTKGRTQLTDAGMTVYDANNKKSLVTNADGMTVYKDGADVASFGMTARIGKASGESRVAIDYHSLQLVDKEGETYFHVSDLRDASGYATLTEMMVFDDQDSISSYKMSLPASNVVKVAVGSSGDADDATALGTSEYSFDSSHNQIVFNPPLGLGTGDNTLYGSDDDSDTLYLHTASYLFVTYKTTEQGAKAYTVGRRRANSNIGGFSFAEGCDTTASGYTSHAEGYYTQAKGYSSHAEGSFTTANGDNSHVEGRFNVKDENGIYAHIIGNGTSESERSNALTVAWANGDVIQWTGADFSKVPAKNIGGSNKRVFDSAGNRLAYQQPVRTPTGVYYSLAVRNPKTDKVAALYLTARDDGGQTLTLNSETTLDAKYIGGTLPAAHGGTGITAFGTVSNTSGSNVSVASEKWVQLASVSLAAGKWLVIVGCYAASNKTGRRWWRLSSDAIADFQSDRVNTVQTTPGVTGAVYRSLVNYVLPSATTTYRVGGYQDSGAALNMSAYIRCIRLG